MNYREYIVNVNDFDLDDNTVFLGKNENDKSTIIIKNAKMINNSQTLHFNNLEVKTNIVLNDKYNTHLIIYSGNSNIMEKHFSVMFNYLFSKIVEPISADELLILIYSLEELFNTSTGFSENQLIGLIGELITIDYLIDNGLSNIASTYHTNEKSKFDFEITDKVKLEVKTTADEKRIHNFRHSQLVNSDFDIFIVSIIVNVNESGIDIKKIIKDIMDKSDEPELTLQLHKILIRIENTSKELSLKFDYKSTLQSIKFYSAKELPQIREEVEDGIINLEYSIVFSRIKEIIDHLELLSNFKK